MKATGSVPALRMLVSLIVTALVLLACAERQAGNATAPVGLDAQPATSGEAASYRTARSLDELVAQSTTIVIGQMQSTGELINLARDPKNPSLPDPRHYGLGQIYHVAVQRYLKGQGPRMLKVVEAEGFLTNPPATLTPADIDRAKAQDKHIPLRPGRTYLLFLRPLGGFPVQAGYLTGPLEPPRFVLFPDGGAVPETPWEQAQLVFPPRRTDQLLSEVEQLIAGASTTTPTRIPTTIPPLPPLPPTLGPPTPTPTVIPTPSR